VTPVKDQGGCGCCWSFAAIGVVESAWAIVTGGYFVDLAEQPLVDCVQSSIGCKGGYIKDALDYLAQNGAEDETADPYMGSYTGYCTFDANQVGYYVAATTAVNNNEDDLVNALRNTGPVAITLGNANSDAFQYYSGGVISCDPNTPIDHAVLLIGINYEGNYWILKNQWGSWWGNNGFFWLDKDQNCGLYQYPSYVTTI